MRKRELGKLEGESKWVGGKKREK
jgi:hypothetical protein